jgi:hypothetical protein
LAYKFSVFDSKKFIDLVEPLRRPMTRSLIALAISPAFASTFMIPGILELKPIPDAPSNIALVITYLLWSYLSTAPLVFLLAWARSRSITLRGPIWFPAFVLCGIGAALIVTALVILLPAALFVSHSPVAAFYFIYSVARAMPLDFIGVLAFLSLINFIGFVAIADDS